MKRWAARPYNATHKGNFIDELGIDIDCYVLDDAAKTAVISQRGMGEAIGFSRRGSRLTVFVNSQTMANYIGRDLLEKFNNPLVFQPPKAAAAGGVAATPNGYDAALPLGSAAQEARAEDTDEHADDGVEGGADDGEDFFVIDALVVQAPDHRAHDGQQNRGQGDGDKSEDERRLIHEPVLGSIGIAVNRPATEGVQRRSRPGSPSPAR